jgi:hypothetical protein
LTDLAASGADPFHIVWRQIFWRSLRLNNVRERKSQEGAKCGWFDVGRNLMAKEKPTEELSGIAKQSIEQARGAVDIYFDMLKKAVSSYPTGGTELGEKLKTYAQRNVSTTHEFVKELSHAKDFQEFVGIQTHFMQNLATAFGEQTKSLTEAYTKTAADTINKPFGGTS